jgi:hypothetical protein
MNVSLDSCESGARRLTRRLHRQEADEGSRRQDQATGGQGVWCCLGQRKSRASPTRTRTCTSHTRSWPSPLWRPGSAPPAGQWGLVDGLRCERRAAAGRKDDQARGEGAGEDPHGVLHSTWRSMNRIVYAIRRSPTTGRTRSCMRNGMALGRNLSVFVAGRGAGYGGRRADGRARPHPVRVLVQREDDSGDC